MTAPLVTIGITCFNAADTIVRAVRSAFNQDWPHFEVVIVDDCSTDESAELILTEIDRKPRATLIRHCRNSGPAAARNTILSEGKGEYIVFFDDDDESLPSRISRQIATLSAYEKSVNTDLIACYASGVRRYPNGYNLKLPAIGSKDPPIPYGTGVADYLLTYRRQPGWFYGSGTPTCSLLARRSTYAAIGGFDVRLRRLEDADFAIRLALAGGHFIGTTEVLFIQYSTDALDKTAERNLKARQRLAYKHRGYLEEINRFEYARRWSRLRYWHFTRRYGRFVVELGALLRRYPCAVTTHLLNTGPRRLIHEARMWKRKRRVVEI